MRSTRLDYADVLNHKEVNDGYRMGLRRAADVWVKDDRDRTYLIGVIQRCYNTSCFMACGYYVAMLEFHRGW